MIAPTTNPATNVIQLPTKKLDFAAFADFVNRRFDGLAFLDDFWGRIATNTKEAM